MANKEHIKILKQGVKIWNKWREENPDIKPDLISVSLSGVNFSGFEFSEASLNLEDKLIELLRTNLRGINLRGSFLQKAHLRNVDFRNADLRGANLSEADLIEVDLRGAELSDCVLYAAVLIAANLQEVSLKKAYLDGANLSGVNLTKADLHRASLISANLSGANLSEANLSKADLRKAILVETNLEKAILSDCKIFGISAWDLNLTDTIQKNLDISEHNQSTIKVDNLEVAQFIYLLLHNEKIRDIIDTIGKKAVLILGRFTPGRKKVLEAIREELRKRDYLPILFDFEKPGSKDLAETVSILAHISRFIIADITDAKSIPQELQTIVPNLPSVAVQPIIHVSDNEYGMFEHFQKYPWVLPLHRYQELEDLIAVIGKKVIEPAEAKVKELRNL